MNCVTFALTARFQEPHNSLSSTAASSECPGQPWSGTELEALLSPGRPRVLPAPPAGASKRHQSKFNEIREKVVQIIKICQGWRQREVGGMKGALVIPGCIQRAGALLWCRSPGWVQGQGNVTS